MIVFWAFVALLLAPLDLIIMPGIAIALVNWWAVEYAVYTSYSDKVEVKSGYKLPRWLKDFDTFDADLDEGTRSGLIKANSLYEGRVEWLNRNPAYGFSYWRLGKEFKPDEWRMVKYVNTPDKLFFFAVSKSGLFNLHCNVGPVRIKFGWKAWNYYKADTNTFSNIPFGPLLRVPFVASISRFN